MATHSPVFLSGECQDRGAYRLSSQGRKKVGYGWSDYMHACDACTGQKCHVLGRRQIQNGIADLLELQSPLPGWVSNTSLHPDNNGKSLGTEATWDIICYKEFIFWMRHEGLGEGQAFVTTHLFITQQSLTDASTCQTTCSSPGTPR